MSGTTSGSWNWNANINRMAEKRNQASLFTFFSSSKSRRLEENTSGPANIDCELTVETQIAADDKGFIKAEQLPTPTNDSVSVEVVNLDDGSAGHCLDSLDIGQALKASALTDHRKHALLNGCWTPDAAFTFPIIDNGKQTRRFSRNWLERYSPWLAYTASEGKS